MKTSYLIMITVFLAVLSGVFFSVPAEAQGLPDLSNVKIAKPEQKTEAKETEGSETTLRPYTGPKKRLGVMDMEVKITTSTSMEPTHSGGVISTTSISIPPPSDFGQGLTEMLTTALIDSNRFIVLERKALMDIQSEHMLQSGGSVDMTSAVGTDRLLGAQTLIRGAVTEYTYRRTSAGGNIRALDGIGVGTSSAEASVGLDIRIYDVATGQIIDSVNAEGRARTSALAVDIDKKGLQMSASGFAQTPLGQATRQAIDRAVVLICERMDVIPWEGRIAEYEEDENGDIATVYINAGSNLGLKEKDVLEIFRPGRAITDPETRVMIGRTKDVRLGSCRIESVTQGLSRAVIIEGQGFEIGHICRFPDPKAKPQTTPSTP